MAASEKVYVCVPCKYTSPDLKIMVAHMATCKASETKKKEEEKNQDEDNDILFDDSDNSESAIEYSDIAEIKEPHQKQTFLDGTLTSTSCLSGYYNQTIDVDRSSPAPFLWSKKTGMILLNLLKTHKDDMESPYIRRKTVWQKIAMEMQGKYGYSVSATQCENKFKNMSNRYRKARDYNLHTENLSKQTCFLYDELHEYYTSDARYQPRRDSMYDVKDKSNKNMYDVKDKSPKIIRPIVVSSNSDRDCIEKETILLPNTETITISEGENSNSFKDTSESEAEPIWVKKMMETFERCHRENMKMQREFINILQRILEKK